jgi:heme/copper-type cytochrome/quinol oxidase subunit 2
MLEILFLFWYCFDDRLAAAFQYPALGNFPAEIWWAVFAIWIIIILFKVMIDQASKR